MVKIRVQPFLSCLVTLQGYIGHLVVKLDKFAQFVGDIRVLTMPGIDGAQSVVLCK